MSMMSYAVRLSLVLSFLGALSTVSHSNYTANSDDEELLNGMWEYTAVHGATSPLVYPAKTDDGTREDVHDQKEEEQHKSFVIHMYFALTNMNTNREQLFVRYANSLLRHTQSNLQMHAVVDEGGKVAVTKAISNSKTERRIAVDIQFYDVHEMAKQVDPIVDSLRQHFSAGQRSHYHNPIFFLPALLHHLLPDSVKRVIVLDTDMEFRADISSLYGLFDNFSQHHIMGLAYDQQPVYRHILHMYRREHPGTRVGDPPPNGLAGFNSGCVLMDLEKMRGSQVYNNALTGDYVKNLADKFHFQGHLGDQDFYSLLSMEHPHMFYILPCTWNRQLCTWWRDHGYADVFDQYNKCEGKVNLYHGNCNTPIPQDDVVV